MKGISQLKAKENSIKYKGMFEKWNNSTTTLEELGKEYDIIIYLDEKKPYALAVFNDDDLAQAIGINGSNIKLTTKVSGYEIDAVSCSQYVDRKMGYWTQEIRFLI